MPQEASDAARSLIHVSALSTWSRGVQVQLYREKGQYTRLIKAIGRSRLNEGQVRLESLPDNLQTCFRKHEPGTFLNKSYPRYHLEQPRGQLKTA